MPERFFRPIPCFDTPRAARRSLRCGAWTLACLTLAVGAGLPFAPAGPRPSMAACSGEAGDTEVTGRERPGFSALPDPLYDEFLKRFAPALRDGPSRRYLTAQVVVAAAMHDLDPALLFALVTAESNFDSHATSPKGAGGLGQVRFATARAVAPLAIRQPEDLYDVPRNLYAAARHMRQLLDRAGGDFCAALHAYHVGGGGRKGEVCGRDRYVARVLAYYAYLKSRHTHRLPPEAAAGGEDPEDRGAALPTHAGANVIVGLPGSLLGEAP